MTQRMHRPILVLIASLFLCSAAKASEQGVNVMRNWKQMDICSQKAQAAFPDFTPEANAKRDAQLQACLNGQNLPPRAPLSSPK